ncbi:MAG: radical SAM protein, partial [Andreesenia angusta]|nr:radical SAM protein [Andreesenia angusta]
MISLYINHKNEFEISNLIKIFFFRDKINILENKEEFDKIDSNNTIKILSLIEGDKLKSRIEYKNQNIGFDLDINEVDILESDQEKRQKIGIRRSLYEALIKYSGKNMNWGILTGVRPVKIVHHLQELGYNKQDIRDLLLREYRLSKEKAELIMGIADLEKDIIYPLDKNRYSLYIGIPFCPTRCSYCSFTSNRYDEKLADKYLDYLEYEIKRVSELLIDKKLNTVYIGGGTPTALNLQQLDRLLKKLKENFPIENKEFTVEAGRPDTIDREKLELLREYGVNRISINPQTMN